MEMKQAAPTPTVTAQTGMPPDPTADDDENTVGRTVFPQE